MNKIFSGDIVKLLELKHHEDIFVAECKTGPTWGNDTMGKMDAWVMPKSWSRFNTIGYEIKTTRSDFLKDDKWRSYLPYCHSFYFVCPPDLIKEEELSAEAGLMYVSSTATRLFTKKKAPFRDVEIPIQLFVYILMCRTHIDKEYPSLWDKVRVEAKERKYEKRWGHAYGRRLNRLIEEEINKVKKENEQLRDRIEYCEIIEKCFKECGFNLGEYGWMREQRLKEDIMRVNQPFAGRLNGELDHAIENLQKLKEVLGKR